MTIQEGKTILVYSIYISLFPSLCLLRHSLSITFFPSLFPSLPSLSPPLYISLPLSHSTNNIMKTLISPLNLPLPICALIKAFKNSYKKCFESPSISPLTHFNLCYYCATSLHTLLRYRWRTRMLPFA